MKSEMKFLVIESFCNALNTVSCVIRNAIKRNCFFGSVEASSKSQLLNHARYIVIFFKSSY